MAPGAVVSEVARRWQLSSQQVFGGRRDARGLAGAAGGRDCRQLAAVASLPAPDFVPVLAEAAPAAVPAPAPEATSGVEVAGAVVRVRPGMDAALLTSVLCAVRASAAGA